MNNGDNLFQLDAVSVSFRQKQSQKHGEKSCANNSNQIRSVYQTKMNLPVFFAEYLQVVYSLGC